MEESGVLPVINKKPSGETVGFAPEGEIEA